MTDNDKMKLSRKIVFSAAIFGVLGVVFGAFGAHALKSGLEERGMVDAWDTAVKYHLVHTVALLALGALADARFDRGGAASGLRSKLVGWAAGCWVAGITLFSGSLYLLALDGPRWLGPVTPLGGLALIAGWILVAIAAWRG